MAPKRGGKMAPRRGGKMAPPAAAAARGGRRRSSRRVEELLVLESDSEHYANSIGLTVPHQNQNQNQNQNYSQHDDHGLEATGESVAHATDSRVQNSRNSSMEISPTDNDIRGAPHSKTLSTEISKPCGSINLTEEFEVTVPHQNQRYDDYGLEAIGESVPHATDSFHNTTPEHSVRGAPIISQEANHNKTLSEMFDLAQANDDDDDDDGSSLCQNTLERVGKYSVRKEHAPTLGLIIGKYGDIGAKCSYPQGVARLFLEKTCEIVEKLQSLDLKTVKRTQLESMRSVVIDIDDVIDVSWLATRLDEVLELKAILNQPSLKVDKVKNAEEIKELEKEIEEDVRMLKNKEEKLGLLKEKKRIIMEECQEVYLRLQPYYQGSLVCGLF